MKLTEKRLRKLIKEEISNVLRESKDVYTSDEFSDLDNKNKLVKALEKEFNEKVSSDGRDFTFKNGDVEIEHTDTRKYRYYRVNVVGKELAKRIEKIARKIRVGVKFDFDKKVKGGFYEPERRIREPEDAPYYY